MSKHDFLQRFGVFSQDGFLCERLCSQFFSEMEAHTYTQATVSNPGSVPLVDLSYRNTLWTAVSPAAFADIQRRLQALMPALEAYFQIKLDQMQRPDLLVYREGAFFNRHRDGSDHPDETHEIAQRKISTVLFMNGAAEESASGKFTGGELTLHGLFGEEDWAAGIVVPIQAEPGLLVAFRSGVLHEVKPVTSGTRCSIVTWFR